VRFRAIGKYVLSWVQFNDGSGTGRGPEAGATAWTVPLGSKQIWLTAWQCGQGTETTATAPPPTESPFPSHFTVTHTLPWQ
jgi:hypothetical protein